MSVSESRMQNAQKRVQNGKEQTAEIKLRPGERAEFILNSMNCACLELDEKGTVIFVNEKAKQLFDLTEEQMLAKNICDIFPEAKESGCFETIQGIALNNKTYTHHAYVSAVLNKWILVSATPTSTGCIVLFTEIEDLKKTEQVTAERAQAALENAKAEEALRINERRMRGLKEAFQAVVNGVALKDALNLVARIVTEETGGAARTAFYIANADGTSLHPVQGAGNMPESYMKQMGGFIIGKDSLSCGLAIPSGRPVITRDVFEEPLWAPWLYLAKDYGFRGCWSFPIRTRDSTPIGTFAMYFRTAHTATPRDLTLADVVTQTAAVIISSHTVNQERARAEEALRKSEEKYRAIFNSINEGFSLLDIQFDANGKAYDVIIRDANPAQDRIDGARALIGKRVRKFLPDIEMKWMERYANIVRSGQPEHFEDWSEANQRWYEVHASRVGGEGSTLVAIVYNDITERRKAETALKKSQQQLALSLEAAGMGTFEWTSDFHRVELSENSIEVFGLIPGKPFPSRDERYKLIHADDIEKHHEIFERAGKFGEDYYSEYRIIRPRDGKIAWIAEQGKAIKDEKGKTIIRGVHWDITEKRNAEEAIRQSEEKLRHALEIETVGVIYFKADGSITDSNDAFLRMSGYTRQDLAAGLVRWDIMTPPEYMPVSLEALNEYLKYGRTTPYEKEYLSKDGIRWWALFAATKLNEEEGVEFVIDITKSKKIEEVLRQSELHLRKFNIQLGQQVADRTGELKESEEKLVEKNKQLELTISQLESFNYIASHDLQEPLRKIQTFVELMQENRHDEETLNKYVNKINDSSVRMSQLIDDLLAYSRLGRGIDAFQPTNLNEILEHVKTDFEITITEKQAVIYSDLLPTIRAIPFQMHQLFSNVISNSLKFSERHPEIRITSRQVDRDQIEIKDENETARKFTELKFSDNGIGFENQYSERIFQVFQRLHSQSRYSGTGIGLSIVDKIVKNHNGFVKAEGETGKGATFTIYLPLE